jgi:hypothetical protein
VAAKNKEGKHLFAVAQERQDPSLEELGGSHSLLLVQGDFL